MSESKKEQPILNEITQESVTENGKRSSRLRRSVRKVITEVCMATSVTSPIIPELASSAVASEVAATVAATTAATWVASKAITLAAAVELINACERPDNQKPRVEIPPKYKSWITIRKPEILKIQDNNVYLWSEIIGTCVDDESWIRSISVTIDGKPASSWTVVDKSCKIRISCKDNSANENPSEVKTVEVTYENNEKPKYSFHKESINVAKWANVDKNGKSVLVWWEKTFAWDSDDYTLTVKLGGEDITDKLPFSLGKTWGQNLEYILTNEKNWQSDSRVTKVTVEKVDNDEAPEIVSKYNWEINIIGWVDVTKADNQLLFWDVILFEWTDDNTKDLDMSFEIKTNWEKWEEAWKTVKTDWEILEWKFTVRDGGWKSNCKEFSMKSKGIDLKNLNNIDMRVGKNIDLLPWISDSDGLQIVKVEIEINGKRYEVDKNERHNYVPNQTWKCYIYVTEKGPFGNVYEDNSKELIINKEYREWKSIPISNLDAGKVLPKINQIQSWDMDAYEHIRPLGIAESIVSIKMNKKYGAGPFSPEEIEEYTNRLNIWMRGEIPLWYDNYSMICWEPATTPDSHASNQWSIMNDMIPYGNYVVIPEEYDKTWQENLWDFAKKNKNSINIIRSSSYSFAYNKHDYDDYLLEKDIIDVCSQKNVIMFASGTNIKDLDWVIINQIYNGEYYDDEHWFYSLASLSNSDKNTYPDSHLYVTIPTDADWDIDQTNEYSTSAKVPRHINRLSLFSWRAFPYKHYKTWLIMAEGGSQNNWRYSASYTGPFVASSMGLNFLMKPDVADVDPLIEMTRATCLTDYIRFNGTTQELQLINPAWFFREYCMIADIPSTINAWETVDLNKWRYKWLIFEIPWAEVYINWKWIEYSKENESIIKSQNPMNLIWRLNWDLVAEYSKDGLVTWRIVAVDDERNGLNSKDGITIHAGVQWSMIDIPYSIYPWETIMLTNWSRKWLIYDIPWSEAFIKWKWWVVYNDTNKDLIKSQDLKNVQRRLNWDLVKKDSGNGGVKWTVFAINGKWDTFDKREIFVGVEGNIKNDNWYIAQWYTKTEWEYVKQEWTYIKNEKWYIKNVWNYDKSETWYIKKEWNYRRSEWNYKKHSA